MYPDGGEPVVRRNDIKGDRDSIRKRSVNTALALLIMYLKEA